MPTPFFLPQMLASPLFWKVSVVSLNDNISLSPYDRNVRDVSGD